ncbi:MAG: hypothetical protein ACYTGP_07050, partial [Planctomycetota bacterium]
MSLALTRLALAVVCAATLWLPAPARADDSSNAATWYRRAMGAFDKLSRADQDLIFDYSWNPGDPPSAEVRGALARAAPVLRYLERGARQDHYDLELDYSQGYELHLPHLATMRGITRIAAASAYTDMHDGDAAGSARTLGALYRAGGHMSGDRILISTLVGQAIFRAADKAVTEGFDRAAYGPAESQQLARAARSLDANDPFGTIDAFAAHPDWVVSWVMERCRTEEGRAEPFDPDWMNEDDRKPFERLAELDDAEFDHALGQYDALMGRAIEIIMDPDAPGAEERMAELQAEIDRGEHGPLASAVAPSLTGVLTWVRRGNTAVHDRVEMLSKIAAGELEPDAGANAAFYYRRAIERLGETDPEALQAIWTLSRTSGFAAPDETTTRALVEVKPI